MLKTYFPDEVVRAEVVGKRPVSKRVTYLKLSCGHILSAINPITDTSHPCCFCSNPNDKGLKKLERRWKPPEKGEKGERREKK